MLAHTQAVKLLILKSTNPDQDLTSNTEFGWLAPGN